MAETFKNWSTWPRLNKNVKWLCYVISLIKSSTLLAIYLFLDGAFLGIINIDGILTTSKYITNNKFALDVITRIFNFGKKMFILFIKGFVMSYPTAIELLYPRETSGSGNGGITGMR